MIFKRSKKEKKVFKKLLFKTHVVSGSVDQPIMFATDTCTCNAQSGYSGGCPGNTQQP